MKFLRVRNIILIAILIAVFAMDCYSQAPIGEMRSIWVAPNNDTIVANRQYGDWWFGAFGGPNLNIYFGDLIQKENPAIDLPTDTRKLTFNSSFGGGYYLGLYGEYLPIGEKWGYGLKLTLFDLRKTVAETDQLDDSLKTNFEYSSVQKYFTISPSVRYNLPFWNMYAFGGLDVELATGEKAQQRKKFINTAYIDEWINVPGTSLNTRFGMHVGMGFDFWVADINRKFRAQLSPYFSINGGTKVITNLGSSWNTLTFKVGLGVKFGKDRIDYDTLEFDPTYVDPTQVIAMTVSEGGVGFGGYDHYNALPANSLAMVKVPEIKQEVTVAENTIKEEVNTSVNPEIKQRTPNIRIVPNQMRMFTFPTTTSAQLSQDAINYLDAVAKYMKANPGSEIRITGHSDDRGSITENTARSKDRANAAKNYLIGKGVPAGKILAQFRGAVSPLVPNTTNANRTKNRRIEIIIVNTR